MKTHPRNTLTAAGMVARLATVVALSVAIGAASPATLEAQRRQPTGIPRPARVWSQSDDTCATKKLKTVVGMTFVGAILGMLATMIATPVAVYTHDNAPRANFFGTFALIGLVAGVVIAVAEPCGP